MQPKPLVSVLINNYNYGRFLAQAVESALDQTYPNVEVIVVDDGSTDNSREVIAGYGQRIVPVLKKNGGQSSAINSGFAISKGEIICLLDSDDVFLPHKIKASVEEFQKDASCGFFFHALTWASADLGQNLRVMPEYTWSGRLDFVASARRWGRINFTAPATSGTAFRRELLSRLLPLPEELKYCSDNYLKLVAAMLSPGYYSKEALAVQRIHSNNVYTCRPKGQNEEKFAEQAFLVAGSLRKRHAEYAFLSENLFARAIASYYLTPVHDQRIAKLAAEFLGASPMLSKINIFARAGYHLLKHRLRSREVAAQEPNVINSIQ